MCLFKLWGSNLSQFFLLFVCLFFYTFKGVVLELLAPTCKKEKSNIHSCGFFPLEASFPALDRGVDRFSTKAFLPWLNLVCPLLMQASHTSIPVLPLRRDGDAPGVDQMAFHIDLVPYHQDLCLMCLFLWCYPGWSRVAFWNVSQARTTRGSICLPWA